jgi:hypothetical protein
LREPPVLPPLLAPLALPLLRAPLAREPPPALAVRELAPALAARARPPELAFRAVPPELAFRAELAFRVPPEFAFCVVSPELAFDDLLGVLAFELVAFELDSVLFLGVVATGPPFRVKSSATRRFQSNNRCKRPPRADCRQSVRPGKTGSRRSCPIAAPSSPDRTHQPPG